MGEQQGKVLDKCNEKQLKNFERVFYEDDIQNGT